MSRWKIEAVMCVALAVAACGGGGTALEAGDDGQPEAGSGGEGTANGSGGGSASGDNAGSDGSDETSGESADGGATSSESTTPNDGGAEGDEGDAPGLTDFVGASAADPCVQAEHFLLGLTPAPENSAYAEPALDVACSNTQVTVMSNNIPSFPYVQKTPNALVEMDMTYHFPRFPAAAATTSAVPLGGTVAVAVNGLAIFGPTEAPMMGYRDPYLDGLLDACNGHTAPGGMYHFHARPDCLFTDLAGNVRLVVAYAFDGFPILAPYTCSSDGDCTQTSELHSSWQRLASKWNGDTPNYQGTSRGSWDIHEYVAGSGDLDECNGRELPGGGYAYYATGTFPYFIGCYRGTPTAHTGH